MSDTREKIRSFILTTFLDGNEASLKDNVSLERSHIVDSARVLEIILFLEETFAITVENDDAIPDNFDTVDNIVAYVNRKIAR
jgi:acyl carrier protein